MKSAFALLSVICCLALAGCAKPMTPEILAAADYGPPPPVDYEEIVKKNFRSFLFSTKTGTYNVQAPVKAYVTHSAYIDREAFGWAVCGTMNRSYSLRAYAGSTEPVRFMAFFRDDKIITELIGRNSANNPTSFDPVDMLIKDICKGV